MKTRLLRLLLRLALVPTLTVVLPGVALVCWYLWLHWSGNYHPVLKGELYRSGQLVATDLKERIDHDHLKSILNLRGPNPSESWYQDELAVSLANGVEHLDITLSAGTAVSLDQTQRIIEILEHAPKPLLVHCSDGADRTGLVVGLYLAEHGRADQEAQAQLSLRFGHFPYAHWAFSQSMDDSLELYLTQKKSLPH
jgi:protein tyrosine phosphatase (PTP) superfamily phosphohydrolase (DUF442 family)